MADEPNGQTPEQDNDELSIGAQRIAKVRAVSLDMLAAARDDSVEAFIDKVLLSKPCSPVTRRAIDILVKHANAEIARLNKEHLAAVEHVQQEHRATLEQVALDAAVTEGIDLAVFQLQAPGDVPPYWKPR